MAIVGTGAFQDFLFPQPIKESRQISPRHYGYLRDLPKMPMDILYEVRFDLGS